MREANVTLGDPEFDAMGIEEVLSLGTLGGLVGSYLYDTPNP